MENNTKKSRKKVHNYIFDSENATKVEIDLNNYEVKCSVTGSVKKFYHKYLANLIRTKYDNCIDTFEKTYVSREAGPDKNERDAKKIQERIDRLFYQIKELKAKKAELAS